MNIVFFGSGEFGVPTLARLASAGGGHRVVAVVTQPDRPAGRGGKVTPTPVAQWAAANLPGVPVYKPEKVSEAGVTAELRRVAGVGDTTGGDSQEHCSGEQCHQEGRCSGEQWHQCCFVVIAFGQKMPAALLEGVFAINLHASLLPRWRGAAPINAAILAGDAETGNSVITLANRMDAGLVLGQTRRVIEPRMTAGELHDVLAADGPELVERVLREHERGELRPVTQDESLVTKAAKLIKADGVMDWSRSAVECRGRVHGLTPWPGVTVVVGAGGREMVKLLRVMEEEKRHCSGEQCHVGSLIDVERGLVACGGGTVLRMVDVQPAGKKGMRWEDFVRGRKIEKGAELKAPGAVAE